MGHAREYTLTPPGAWSWELTEPRVVAKDNTLVFHKLIFQIDKQPGRCSCDRARVLVREHRDGTHSIWLGPQCLALCDARGRPISPYNGKKRKRSRVPSSAQAA